MTSSYPYSASTDVRLVTDPAREYTVVEVHNGLAELRNGGVHRQGADAARV